MPRETHSLLYPQRGAGEPSATVRERVMAIRARQIGRQGQLNGALSGAEINRHCTLTSDARHLLGNALDRLGLSARGYHKVIKLALTIADMADADTIAEAHVAEAISYRVLDRPRRGR